MFEESKIWVLLFIVGILISLGYGSHYLSSVDEANLALQDSKSKLMDMREQVILRNKAWDENAGIVGKLQTEADKNATLLKAKDILDQRFAKAEKDLNLALESMKTAVDKTRNNAQGTEVAEITLSNGKALRNVKMRKVEDQGISLIHADGIGTIPAELLPDNLKEQYDLGPNALVPMIQKAQTALIQKPDKDNENKLPPTPETPSDKPNTKTTIDDSKVKQIKLRMAELDSRITTYDKAQEKFRQAALNHQSLATSAKARGQPSTRHTENANENLAQAAVLERQVAALREERGKLNVELEYAIRGN
ncbi:hypothetical protein [Prosthecobacter sp.]|jgi:hypothetical protein|uniref:hypothetical protein n=1 Tax=Prosthecobacter sp. TaxID=1965333 RepID=UPI0037CAE03D